MALLLNTFKALADDTRLRILRVLQLGAFNVNELVGILEMGQSRVSRHLKILFDAGLLEARRQGSWVYYGLSDAWATARKVADAPGFLALLGKEIHTQLDGERQAVEACLQKRREEAERFFRDVASRWDRQRDQVEGPPRHLDRLVAALGNCGTVVDLGTGTGVLLSRLSQIAERVIGVDASAEMLRSAGQNVARWKLSNVELRLGALEHLPLPDGEADAMVANMVLHHVADPPLALQEVRRGLGDGGRLVLADLTSHGEESYREKLGDLWLGFERRELERWLAETEFALESYEELETDSGRPGAQLLVARRGKRDTYDIH